MNIKNEINKYVKNGYTNANAISKVCQDIILLKISEHGMANNVTIKGGVVMMQLSKDKRRATQDLDIDFIKYSLSDEAIISFINKISDKDISLNVVTPIQKLNHQDYEGKRVFIEISDNFKNKYNAKIDLGVHKYMDIEQDDMYFDLNIVDETVSLLANSKEQIFVEKLKSLLKFGITSTRYKDIFDFYYLINETNMEKSRCVTYIEKLILKDKKIKIDSLIELEGNLNKILNNKQFKNMLKLAKNNWLELSVDDVVDKIMEFVKSLELVTN